VADSLVGDVAATDPAHERRLALALLAVPAACLGALALMGLVFVSDPPPELVGHLDQFAEGRALYKWGFVGASLIAPTFIVTLVLLLHAARVPPDAARRWIAGILLAGYLTLATIVYSSQYTFLPALVDRDPRVAALWYLHDAGSITCALDLTGYALLALAAITIATTLWVHAGRLRAIAACLVAMGILSLAALGFHAGELSTAASVATISSAAFTLPVLVLAILLGRDLRRRARSPDTTEGDVHP
jgi:hypothetical protein